MGTLGREVYLKEIVCMDAETEPLSLLRSSTATASVPCPGTQFLDRGFEQEEELQDADP